MSSSAIRHAVDARVAAAIDRLAHSSFATVVAVDLTAGMVRVAVQPSGAETGWISDYVLATGSVSFYTPSSLGSQVVVVPVEGGGDEFAIVARCHDVKDPPRTSVTTGKKPQTGECVLTLADGTEVYVAPGRAVVTATEIDLNGAVRINGTLAGSSSATFTGEVKGNGIPLSTHTHPDPQGGNTGAPNA